MSSKDVSLTPKFWRRFRTTYWERKPALLQQSVAKAVLRPEQAFAALLRASKSYRHGEKVPIRLYIDDGEFAANKSKYLPVSDDRSLEGYASRLTRLIDRRRFGLILPEIQAHDFSIWETLDWFFRDFYGATKLPLYRARATLFFGNYSKTPVGIHQGNSSNFKFVLQGRKRMRLWRGRYFRKIDNADHNLEYEPFLKASRTFDANAGDIIYWPSDCWHIGENIDGLAASISLSLFVQDRQSIAEEVWAQAVREAQQRLTDRANIGPPADNLLRDARVLDKLTKRIGGVFTATLSDPQLRERVFAASLNWLSGAGFDVVPPAAAPRALRNHDIVRARARSVIVWRRTTERDIICSANGHSFSVPAHPGLLKLLETVDAGVAHSVGEFSEKFSGRGKIDGNSIQITPKDVREVLEKLVSVRALLVNNAG